MFVNHVVPRALRDFRVRGISSLNLSRDSDSTTKIRMFGISFPREVKPRAGISLNLTISFQSYNVVDRHTLSELEPVLFCKAEMFMAFQSNRLHPRRKMPERCGLAVKSWKLRQVRENKYKAEMLLSMNQNNHNLNLNHTLLILKDYHIQDQQEQNFQLQIFYQKILLL